MAMIRIQKVVVNEVNLGGLYSLSQRSAYLMGGPPTSSHRHRNSPGHGVNLGKLYKTKLTPQQPEIEPTTSLERAESSRGVKAEISSEPLDESKPEQQREPLAAKLDAEALDLEARMRELERRGKLIRWRSKALEFEQGLDLARGWSQARTDRANVPRPSPGVTSHKTPPLPVRPAQETESEYLLQDHPETEEYWSNIVAGKDYVESYDLHNDLEAQNTHTTGEKAHVQDYKQFKSAKQNSRWHQRQARKAAKAQAAAEADIVSSTIKQEDVLPTDALEMLRKRKQNKISAVWTRPRHVSFPLL